MRLVKQFLSVKPVSHILIVLALVDLAFGFGLFLLPDSVTVQRQNTLVGYMGPLILGNLLIFKGFTILLVSLRRQESIRFELWMGIAVWSAFLLLAFLGLLRGNGSNIFSMAIFSLMVYLRYWILCRVGNE